MNQQDRNDGELSDDALASAYRAVSNESVPAELDQQVLKQAAGASKPQSARNWFSSLVRPLSLAAALVLGVAVTLQLNNSFGVLGGDSAAPEQRAVQAGGIVGPSDMSVNDARCDESHTATRDTWLACIDGLVEAGELTAAERERQRLRATFPVSE